MRVNRELACGGQGGKQCCSYNPDRKWGQKKRKSSNFLTKLWMISADDYGVKTYTQTYINTNMHLLYTLGQVFTWQFVSVNRHDTSNSTKLRLQKQSIKMIDFYLKIISGYSRNPCSLNRACRLYEALIESCQFIGWWRDATPDALTSSAYTGERAIYSSDFSAEKNPVGSVRSLAANAASRSLFREQGLRE